MTIATGANAPPIRTWYPWHFAALIGGNVALALGIVWVRMADTGPVSAAFWRLLIAIPCFVVLARLSHQPLRGMTARTHTIMAGAGIFFALDLAAWHLGIGLTRFGNATLFGNSGSILLVAWGLIVLQRWPGWREWAAFGAAITGAAVLLGRSLEIGTNTLRGDLLCLLAGFLYTFYIVFLQKARANLGSWALLVFSSLYGLPVLLAGGLLLGEPVWPHNWLPLIALALTSQVIGQGLLVYSLKHFPPLVVGLALLTQPAVSVAVGWALFGETLGLLDGLGMVLVSLGLVLARSTQD